MYDDRKPSAGRRSGPNTQRGASRVVPEDIADLLDKPPLIHGEDPSDYENLMARIAVVVNPKDVIEWLWVRDIVDILWESRRLRRLRAAKLNIEMLRGSRSLLLPLMPKGPADQRRDQLGDQAEELVREHLGGSAEATATLQARLAHAGLDVNALAAMALDRNLDKVEQIDRLLANNERRRNQILREIDQRRLAFAQRLRDASDAIIEEAVVEEG